MFTGLVQAKGSLVRRSQNGEDARLVIKGALDGEPLELGESIAIDGVCLTVDTIVEDGKERVFEVDASSETLKVTTIGALKAGDHVNLERALAVGQRLGGHLVSGHVDGVGSVVEKIPSGASVKVVFEAPRELARFIAPKGSICVSGVSLTVNGVKGDRFDVMLIPHTQEKTSLSKIELGAKVNLEVDVLARYVARMLDISLEHENKEPAPDSRMLDRLRASGYL